MIFLWADRKGSAQTHVGVIRSFLIRQGDRVYAYVNNCPHYDKAPLGWKKDEFLDGSGQHVMCSSHGALFRISDGECVLGPCLGEKLTPLLIEVWDGDVFLMDRL